MSMARGGGEGEGREDDTVGEREGVCVLGECQSVFERSAGESYVRMARRN